MGPNTVVIRAFTRFRFPEFAPGVAMPASIELALGILGARLLTRGVVSVCFVADYGDVRVGVAVTPICRALERVHCHAMHACVRLRDSHAPR